MGELSAASGRPEAGWLWIKEVEAVGSSLSSLASSGKDWEVLDSKLATAVRKILTGEPGSRIRRVAKEMEKEGNRIRGRQLVWLLLAEFAIDTVQQAAYSLTDLIKLEGPKGKALESWLSIWHTTLCEVENPPEESVLCALFHSKLAGHQELQKELDDFERAAPGSSLRTYASLLKSIEDTLLRKRHKAIRAEYLGALNSGGTLPPSPGLVGVNEPQDKEKKTKKEKKEEKEKKVAAAAEPPVKALPAAPAAATRAATPKPTAVCFDFIEGKCTRGKSCKFAHTATTPPDTPRRSSSNGASPTADPAKASSMPCKYEAQPSGCRLGDKCMYKHSKPALGALCMTLALVCAAMQPVVGEATSVAMLGTFGKYEQEDQSLRQGWASEAAAATGAAAADRGHAGSATRHRASLSLKGRLACFRLPDCSIVRSFVCSTVRSFYKLLEHQQEPRLLIKAKVFFKARCACAEGGSEPARVSRSQPGPARDSQRQHKLARANQCQPEPAGASQSQPDLQITL
jgi:hypothetical protein